MAEPNTSSGTMRKVLLIFLGVILLGFTITYLIFSYTYSEGNRAGLLIKFSKRGYVFKTYEGELNVGGIQPEPANIGVNKIWEFSVKDQAVAEQLQKSEGQYVSLHYKEVVKNFWWQGDTKYFVDGVEVINR